MLKLRLKRVGRKHDPSFRIVVIESSKPAKGRYLEAVGFYNPRLKELELNKDRASYWISNGAQPTPVVHNILVKEGVIEGEKIPVHSRKPSKKKQEEAAAKEEADAKESSTESKEESPEDGESKGDAPEEKPEETKEEKKADEKPKEDKKEEDKKEEAGEDK